MTRPPEKACPTCRKPHFGLDSSGRWRCLTCEPFERLEDAERLLVVYDEQLVEERQRKPSLTPPPGVDGTHSIGGESPRELLERTEAERDRLRDKARREGCLEMFEEMMDRAASNAARAGYSGDPDKAMRHIQDGQRDLDEARWFPFLKDQQEGRKQRARQSNAGKARAKQMWGEDPIGEIVARVVQKPENIKLGPDDLWGDLYAELDRAELDPQEHEGSEKKHDFIRYGDGRSITRQAFGTRVSRLRDNS